MEVKEAIILSGGLGTRLRERIPDLPKTLAPVAEEPFLFYVVDYLISNGINRIILALGYKHTLIENAVKSRYPDFPFAFSIETEPLGTGGAILKALNSCVEKNVLIVNGDTLFPVQLSKMISIHESTGALCTLALKPMHHYDRYGSVIENKNRITGFVEKQFTESGLINGGCYLLNKQAFQQLDFRDKFSFEKDFLEKYLHTQVMAAYTEDAYFIDIGIPEDYEKAQTDLSRNRIPIAKIDLSWTLFLDRDGVINEEIHNNYVNHLSQFKFNKGVKDAINLLSKRFSKIIVVTNQRGVGRGITPEDELERIHQFMVEEIGTTGGKIDAVYYCPEIDVNHPNRKPNPGMGLIAAADFPEIDFSKAIMVGNHLTDMQFGKNLGMYTAFLTTTQPAPPLPHYETDVIFDTLLAFAQSIQKG